MGSAAGARRSAKQDGAGGARECGALGPEPAGVSGVLVGLGGAEEWGSRLLCQGRWRGVVNGQQRKAPGRRVWIVVRRCLSRGYNLGAKQRRRRAGAAGSKRAWQPRRSMAWR